MLPPVFMQTREMLHASCTMKQLEAEGLGHIKCVPETATAGNVGKALNPWYHQPHITHTDSNYVASSSPMSHGSAAETGKQPSDASDSESYVRAISEHNLLEYISKVGADGKGSGGSMSKL